MPPWSARLLSPSAGSSANNAHGDVSTHHTTGRPGPPPHPAIASLQHPTLHPHLPTDDLSRSPSRRHGRSISHTFPAFFGGSKKADRKGAVKQEHILDSTDDDSANSSAGLSASPQKAVARNGFAAGEKESMKGKCMTCDSTVRWPKGIKVFRCTICLTINDLDPPQEARKPAAAPPNGDSYPALNVQRKCESARSPEQAMKLTATALPLSLERTRAIVDRCIDDYLQARLDEPHTGAQEHSPPPSPLFNPHEIPEGMIYHQNRGNGVPSGRETSCPTTTPPPVPAVMPNIVRARTPSNPRLSPGHFFRSGDSPDAQSQQAQMHRRTSDTPGLESANREDGALMTEPEAVVQTGPILRPLDNYLIACLGSVECLNNSFMTARPSQPARSQSEGNPVKPFLHPNDVHERPEIAFSEMDAKTLLLGDFAENGSWWTGSRADRKKPHREHTRDKSTDGAQSLVSLKTPRINWAELTEWYQLVLHAGDFWFDKWLAMKPTQDATLLERWKSVSVEAMGRDISEARLHAHRTLLKATENLLKRPRRPLKHPEDVRFLLMLMANPLLYQSALSHNLAPAPSYDQLRRPSAANGKHTSPSRRHASSRRAGATGHHSGIVKRILGLMAFLPLECHQALVSWFSRFSDAHFQRTIEMVGSFVTYRLTRQNGRKRNDLPKDVKDLVPGVPETGTSAQLHAALGLTHSSSSKSKNEKEKEKPIIYAEDWQIRAAARVMALLFTANNSHQTRKRETAPGLNPKHHAQVHGQILPISTFYNTLLDYSDLISDFEAWESRREKFSFCQYPFFLSIWAKIHIMEYDARRQMEFKAREAFFDSILGRKAVSQYLVFKVRRECLVEDSLQAVSEVVGAGQEEIKKGLRIEFIGEEGVDAGGLRKEWGLELVREIFDPYHGLFVYDEDSQLCYFNPFCFESSEQFFLVGVLLGLAIYNSMILDIALPPFAFKKLLASAPASNAPGTSAPRLNSGNSLEDLAQFRPALARGLRNLLEYEGDVQETFCRDFVAEVDRYGEIMEIPLCPGGQKRAVTNSNRRDFVDLYILYLLDTAVARQFEPFKRGFFTVCAGNALSLFRPEEIELLVRGSEDALDIPSLRAVATYENWKASPESEPTINWFWEFFDRVSGPEQRKILAFITGSDRIPAMGATNLTIRLACLGPDCERYPTARTCFNMLALYKYSSREKLESRLWRAVCDSEGFGLK